MVYLPYKVHEIWETGRLSQSYAGGYQLATQIVDI